MGQRNEHTFDASSIWITRWGSVGPRVVMVHGALVNFMTESDARARGGASS